MTFWNSKRIKDELKKGNLIKLIDESAPKISNKDVIEAAYELSLGPEVYISGKSEKINLKLGDMVAIEPGQIAVLITEEWVEVPQEILGFISLKSRIKVPGLINVSGFHVDPGFKGRLVFTVYNAGTEICAFTRGQKMFVIWFAELSDGGEKGDHKGKRQDRKSILAEDITQLTAEGVSPAKLNKRLLNLELLVKVYGVLLLAFFLSAATMFIRGGLNEASKSKPDIQQPSKTQPLNKSEQDQSLPNNTKQEEISDTSNLDSPSQGGK